MIVALDAAASWTSLWVMPPTPRWTNDSLTSSRSSLRSASVSASSEPVTSALRTRFSVATSPCWICSKMSSSLAPPLVTAASRPRLATRCQCSRVSATERASFSSGATTNWSPASATSLRPSTCTGIDGPASLTLLAVVVDERPDPAPGGAGHERVAHPERAPLDEHRGHRAPADVEVGLEHHAGGAPVGAGLERRVLQVGHEQQRLEQVVDAEALEGRHRHHLDVAAPVAGDEALLGELLLDPVDVGLLAVDLVDGHHDRHLGRLGVVERLDRLRHDAVVGRHHQHDDVGGLGAAARMAVNASWPGVSMKVMRRPFLTRPGRRRCAG